VIEAHAEAQLSAALASAGELGRQMEAEAALTALTADGEATDEEAALATALTAATHSLHVTELDARVSVERDVADLCADLEAEIAEIEARLAETQSVDLSDIKQQALWNAQKENAWEAAEKNLHAALTASPSAATAASAANANANAAGTLAAQPKGSPSGGSATGGTGGGLSQPPSEQRPMHVRKAEAEEERQFRLGELRALIAIRKLRESASESAHARHLDGLVNKAINAIADAVDAAPAGGSATDELERHAPVGLRSVAEVEEAEQSLSEELRAAQQANATMLDRLAALKSSIDATDKQHTRFLHGKARYLVKQHIGVR